MNTSLFTSESVTEGHPDKVCDMISDAVLDDILSKDEDARVACEVCCTTGMVLVMGEITTNCKYDIPQIVRRTLERIGYSKGKTGFNEENVAILVSIHEQSPDIAMGTADEVGGAGDQGMMFGYACNETPDYMPLPISLANRLAYRLAQARKSGDIPFILPDGKTQVTVEYDSNNDPVGIDTIVISTQHEPKCSREELTEALKRYVICPVLEEAEKYLKWSAHVDDIKLLINPTGKFEKGGPEADSGLTGRKIIVDTYGGYAPHGGGAFSGKDPTKVDRSGAYAARYIAKNIVAAGLADRCQVQLAYAIGVLNPVSVRIDTFDTHNVAPELIAKAVDKCVDLSVQSIIDMFDLRRPIYSDTAAYGHFGDVIGQDRPWERLDLVSKLTSTIEELTEG